MAPMLTGNRAILTDGVRWVVGAVCACCNLGYTHVQNSRLGKLVNGISEKRNAIKRGLRSINKNWQKKMLLYSGLESRCQHYAFFLCINHQIACAEGGRGRQLNVAEWDVMAREAFRTLGQKQVGTPLDILAPLLFDGFVLSVSQFVLKGDRSDFQPCQWFRNIFV